MINYGAQVLRMCSDCSTVEYHGVTFVGFSNLECHARMVSTCAGSHREGMAHSELSVLESGRRHWSGWSGFNRTTVQELYTLTYCSIGCIARHRAMWVHQAINANEELRVRFVVKKC